MAKRTKSYGLNNPLQDVFPSPVIAERAPTTNDKRYEIGQDWIDTSTNKSYKLTSVVSGSATWAVTGPGDSEINTLTGDTGGAISPTASNINILGGDTTQVDGSGSTLTINASASGYPITPYIVGPASSAGYTTIQSALDAANAAGIDATIYVQPGTYSENLTLYDGVDIVGSIYPGVTIVGLHTPPTSGRFQFQNITIQSATDIFNSAAAGATNISVINSQINITNGFLFNLSNWTGTLMVKNCDSSSTNDGIMTNTGGASLTIYNSRLGNGTAKTLISSGNINIEHAVISCPIDFQTGTVIDIKSTEFEQSVSSSNNATGNCFNCVFSTGSTTAFTMNSTQDIGLIHCIIDSSGSPVVAGTGTGTLSLPSMTYLTNADLSTDLTILYTRHVGITSPYVVGANVVDQGIGNFATVQEVITTLNKYFGPKFIYLSNKFHTENIDFRGGAYSQDLHIFGLAIDSQSGFDGVALQGTHIAPPMGKLSFQNINFMTVSGDVFSGSTATTTEFIFKDCNINPINGYLINLSNATGIMKFYNCLATSTAQDNGIINNTTGATVEIYDSRLGNNSTYPFITSGSLTMRNSHIGNPCEFQTGTVYGIDDSRFDNTITLSNDSTGSFYNSIFSTGTDPSITMNSSGTNSLLGCIIDSSNSPSITGTGAGTFNLTGTHFPSNSDMSATLTVSGAVTTSATFETVDQASGLQISSSDIDADGSDANIDITITPKGTGNLVLDSGAFEAGAGTDLSIYSATGQDIIIQMGDAAGANKVSFTDSTTAEVFAVDSNGALTFSGLTVTGAFAQTGGTFNVGQDNAANAINIGGGTTARAVGIANSAAAHVLTLGSATAAAQTIAQAGTAGMTLDSTGVLELNSSGAAIGIGNDADAYAINVGTGAAARTVTIGNATGASSVVVDVGTGNADFGVSATAHTTRVGSTTGASDTTIQCGTGALTVNGGGAMDIDAAGQLQINSSASTIDIGNDAIAQNMNIGTGAAARIITIGNVTGASQVVIDCGTAGVSIGASATAHTSTLGSTTGASDTTVQCGTGALTVNGGGAMDIDAAGQLQINSSASTIDIGNDAVAQNMNIGTGAAARTITVGNNTGATSVVVDVGTGAASFGATATAHTTTIGSTTGAAATVIQAGTGEITMTGTVKQIDAELVGWSGVYVPAFTMDSVAVLGTNAGGAPVGTTGAVNNVAIQGGSIMQEFVVGAGQTIIQPIMGANGLIVNGDQANAEGYEYNFPYLQYTIGTSAAFAFELGLYINDMDGAAPYVFGFRKTEANNAAWANYTDYATMGMIAASSIVNIVTATELNSGGQTVTDTTDAWGGDGSTNTLRVLVDASGNVTYTINGAAPTASVAFQFDNADVVIPFIRIEHNANATDVAISSMRIGYQA
jgi:hypothetical protein